MTDERRVMVIDGQRVAVFDRPKPIPASLALMLNGGRDDAGRVWMPLRQVVNHTLRIGGARPECAQQDHRLKPWVEGFHTGSDGVARYLHLTACADCGSVCVRDSSIDSLTGLPTGRLAPRRKSHVIGWYSGARPRQRVYT
jgi:hypothetical protein